MKGIFIALFHCFKGILSVRLRLSITVREYNFPLGNTGNQQDLFIERYMCITTTALDF